MLIVPSSIEQVRQTQLTAASRSGTTVTANASAHVLGAWASLIDPTDHPSYGIHVYTKDVHVSVTATGLLLDIGFGPSGGGSELVLLPQLNCWGTPGWSGGIVGYVGWFFPLYIPTGKRVSARCQARTGGDVVSVAVWLAQKPSYPYTASRWAAYGAVTSGSQGTAVTPGSGSFGSWTEVPASTTTPRNHYLWSVGYDGQADTSLALADVLVEIGHGPDSSNVQSIGLFRFGQSGNEAIVGPYPSFPIYHPVPAGAQLWARIASAETEARGVIIYAGD